MRDLHRCRDATRRVICVVEESRDIVAVEKTGEYHGRYHVLQGAISPIEGVGPDQLRVRELLARLDDEGVAEIILCTNPNLEGEATAMYLSRLIKPLGVKVTRIASGLPVGGDLEYADELTLGSRPRGPPRGRRRLTANRYAPCAWRWSGVEGPKSMSVAPGVGDEGRTGARDRGAARSWSWWRRSWSGCRPARSGARATPWCAAPSCSAWCRARPAIVLKIWYLVPDAGGRACWLAAITESPAAGRGARRAAGPPSRSASPPPCSIAPVRTGPGPLVALAGVAVLVAGLTLTLFDRRGAR